MLPWSPVSLMALHGHSATFFHVSVTLMCEAEAQVDVKFPTPLMEDTVLRNHTQKNTTKSFKMTTAITNNKCKKKKKANCLFCIF